MAVKNARRLVMPPRLEGRWLRVPACGALCLILVANVALAGEPTITILPGVQISADNPRARHVESVLAVNPRDPQNLIAAAVSLGEQRNGISVYTSRDGGRAWTRAASASKSAASFDGLDPAIAFDVRGRAFFLSMSDGGVPVWTSTDGGDHWTGPALVRGSWDRPWIGCDGAGKVLLAGKLPIVVLDHPAQDVVALATSSDQGATFSFPALLLPAPEKHLLNVVSDLLVRPDGQALLVLQVFGPETVGRPGRQPLTGSYPTIVLGGGGVPELRPGPSFRTFGHGWEGKSAFGYGFARVAIDASVSARRGRLYMTFLDAADGYYRVMVATSTDDGRTWSTPVRVSDAVTLTDASNPAIAVNDQGVVGVVWNDRRADSTDRCYQLFFAASIDGGATFSTNRNVGERPTCPIPSNAGDPIASEYRFKNGGDTQGIVGLPGGAFQLAWINGAPGEMQLWSTRILVATQLPAAPHRRESTVQRDGTSTPRLAP